MTTGHKTRYWCSQDIDRKAKSKPSERAGAKHRDNVGMTRFPCKSSLVIVCKRANPRSLDAKQLVTIRLKHACPHTHYFNVDLPPEAADIIREGLESLTPNEMVTRVQHRYPNVTAAQIHSAWTRMSDVLWKRDQYQIPSAKILMSEFSDQIEVLDCDPAEGVEQLAWGMCLIAEQLCGKVVEIGVDATCEFIG